MTWLYKNGKIICVESSLDPEYMIYIKELGINIEVTIRKFKNKNKYKVFIKSEHKLTIPQYVKLQQVIKKSWREHEKIQSSKRLGMVVNV